MQQAPSNACLPCSKTPGCVQTRELPAALTLSTKVRPSQHQGGGTRTLFPFAPMPSPPAPASTASSTPTPRPLLAGCRGGPDLGMCVGGGHVECRTRGPGQAQTVRGGRPVCADLAFRPLPFSCSLAIPVHPISQRQGRVCAAAGLTTPMHPPSPSLQGEPRLQICPSAKNPRQ
ncbi:phosphoinositide 3-kinase adapter protein 1 [Platysternon megacephalum]|uniref:Phosphoinositide 3-kinase adapter protein 1 n=1 Tax=Platysternon megacephalum TaxID=55544 RepID=A0A4D9DWB8_9SAUR|nr:phosphoinositide 3-kinase adapter protein 1 [Platysternon megacephalum]